MNIETLSRRQIREQLKRGLDLTDFAKECGCSEEEVEKKVTILYPRDSSDILKQMSKNTKTRVGKPLGLAIVELAKEQGVDLWPTDDVAPRSEEKSDEKSGQIAQLREEEESLSNEVIQIESEHKAKLQKRSGIISQTQKQREAMEKLFEEFKTRFAKCEDLIGLSNQIAEEMNSLLGLRREKRMALEEIRKRIDDLSNIVVCVYADGTISPYEETSDYLLDDSGYEELFLDLAQKEACAQLKMAEVKTLARLQKIVEHSAFKVEVVSENPELEKAYRALSPEV